MPSAPPIAAQVVIATAAVADDQVTAANIHALLPNADAAARIARAFAALGFAPGPLVGNSFSIEAGAQVFRQVFGVLLRVGADGRVYDAAPRDASTAALTSLPVDRLPATLRAQVQAVVFSEPPAFGPGVMP